MKPGIMSSCLLVTLSILLTQPANAARTVLGTTWAQSCYDAAMEEGATRFEIGVCSMAIEEETLTRRNRAATLVNRGILRARIGDGEAAIRDYDRALLLDPSLIHALINRANTKVQLNQIDGALEDYDQAAFFSQGRNSLIYFNRSFAWVKKGRPDRAREDLVRALRLQPDSPVIRDQLAELDP